MLQQTPNILATTCNIRPQPVETFTGPPPPTTATCTARYHQPHRGATREPGYTNSLSQSTYHKSHQIPYWGNRCLPSQTLKLPRETRVHLARLRCGHHPSLLTYQNRIDQRIDPTCRHCRTTPETISHLLEDCPSLSALRAAHGVDCTSHLWSCPVEAIDFLRSANLL